MEILRLIGALIMMIGVILIYDARPITRKMFSSGDQNEGVAILKIVGFILSMISSITWFI